MTNLTEDAKENLKIVRQLTTVALIYNPVLADLCFAQAILESSLSKSPPSKLALEDNNLFGIKHKGLTGKFVERITHEYVHDRFITIPQKFAKNDSIEDSISQWKMLIGIPRYKEVGECNTLEEAAHKIRECGYATDKNYSEKLIKIYKQFIMK